MVKPVAKLITSIKSNTDTADDLSLSDVELGTKQRNMLSTERAMRNLDTTGRGYLTNERVYMS